MAYVPPPTPLKPDPKSFGLAVPVLHPSPAFPELQLVVIVYVPDWELGLLTTQPGLV